MRKNWTRESLQELVHQFGGVSSPENWTPGDAPLVDICATIDGMGVNPETREFDPKPSFALRVFGNAAQRLVMEQGLKAEIGENNLIRVEDTGAEFHRPWMDARVL